MNSLRVLALFLFVTAAGSSFITPASAVEDPAPKSHKSCSMAKADGAACAMDAAKKDACHAAEGNSCCGANEACCKEGAKCCAHDAKADGQSCCTTGAACCEGDKKCCAADSAV